MSGREPYRRLPQRIGVSSVDGDRAPPARGGPRLHQQVLAQDAKGNRLHESPFDVPTVAMPRVQRIRRSPGDGERATLVAERDAADGGAMEPNSSTSDLAFLEELRRHRAELRESMSALEGALAAPATADQVRWAAHVHAALVELAGDFREHIAITEGSDGLYRDLLEISPRLSDAVASLTREHVLICGQVDDLLARLTAPRHRGRGQDPRRGYDAARETRPTPPARLRPRLRGLRVRHRGRDLSSVRRLSRAHHRPASFRHAAPARPRTPR